MQSGTSILNSTNDKLQCYALVKEKASDAFKSFLQLSNIHTVFS